MTTIKEQLLKKKMSRAELSKKINISTRSLGYYIHSKQMPSVITALKIARIFKLRVENFKEWN